MDFGNGSYRGAGVVTGGFLVDADGGAQPLDGVDIGFVHDAEELTGIGR